MADLVIAFALVTPLAFGGVFCLFGVLDWVQTRLEERAYRMKRVWLQGRERP